MLSKVMSSFMFLLGTPTANFLGIAGMNWWPGRGLMWHLTRRILQILYSGSLLAKSCRVGAARGVAAGLVGTSNAPQWRLNISAVNLISMAAGRI